MKSFRLTLAMLLACVIAHAQEFAEVEQNLIQEKTFQAQFHLNAIKKSKKDRPPKIQFRINNLQIEIWQINKKQKDSIACLIRANELLFGKETDGRERAYFTLLKSTDQLSKGSTNEAVASLKKISSTTPRIRGNALMQLADAFRSQRKSGEALQNFNLALQTFRNDSVLFYYKIYRCHLLSGIVDKNIKQYAAAEREYKTALHILDLIPDPMASERSKILNNLGNVYSETNSYNQAKAAYLESHVIKEKIERDSFSLATTYSNIATFYSRFGNFTQAKTFYEKSLQIFPSERNASTQTLLNILISNYSYLLREQGEYTQAALLVDQAIASSVSHLDASDPSVVKLKIRKSEIELLRNDIDGGGGTLAALEKTFDPTQDKATNIEYLMAKSYYLYDAHQYDSCFRICKKLLKEFESVNPNLSSDEYYFMASKAGNALDKLGNKPGAINYYRQAYEAAAAANKITNVMLIQRTLAIAFFESGELDSSAAYTRKTMKLNFISNDHQKNTLVKFIDENMAIECFLQLADIAFARYRNTKDARYLRESEQQITLCLRLVKKKRDGLLTDEDKFDFGRYTDPVFPDAADIYYECYRSTGDDSYIEKMLLVSELSKAQSLQANLKKQNIESFAGVTKAVNDQESAIAETEKNVIHDIAWQVSKGNDLNEEVLTEQNERLTWLQKKKSGFLDSMRQKLPGYYQLKYDQTTIVAAELQKQLDDGTLLLEYMNGNHHLYVTGFTKAFQFTLALPGTKDLNRFITQLRNHLKFKFEKELITDGTALYTQLLNPVDSLLALKHFKTTTLVVIPHGMLTLLPFDLLIDEQVKGIPHYLIERQAIYYNYSATLWWQKNTDQPEGRKKGMAGYAPRFGAAAKAQYSGLRSETADNFDFDDLAESEAEVEGIARLYKRKLAGESKIYNEQANEVNFKHMQFDQYSFVHLATHGFAGLSGPRSSGLALQRGSGKMEDDILFSEEIYGLRMPVELVTLSACETGLGKYQSGEGLVGMARAFFYAGARSVLVSLWKVQDKSTSELMVNFYDSYFSAVPDKSSALRKAKLKMLHSRDYSNPYYWAPFILLGAN